MGSYNWKAVPEAVWASFALAFSGLVGAIMVTAEIDPALIAAVTAFIASTFRLFIALLAAFTSKDGTVSTGTGTDPAPIPPSE